MRISAYTSAFLSAIAIPIIAAPAFSQDAAPPPPPLEWGSVPASDLTMRSYAADTNVSAIVLCDYGESFMNDDMSLVFKRHERIKILKAAGYEWGTHLVSIYADQSAERIDDIEGSTFTVGSDGSVIRTELDGGSVFKEDYDGRYERYRFTLPNLQPGCIVEFRYTITARSLFDIHDWVFQTSIPTLWSEYRVTVPQRLAYAVVSQGFEPYQVNEQTTVKQHFSRKAAEFVGESFAWCNLYRWALRNAPALPEEPFTTTINDYANKIDIQLAGYADPRGGVTRVLKTWEDLVTELADHPEIGRRIRETGSTRALADQLTSGLTTPDMRMAAVYDYVRSNIVWNHLNRIFAARDADDVLESKKGDCAEITYLLLSLLKCAGIEGEPVILSTRTHGKIQDAYPMVAQFNYVIARARIGTATLYLDATDPQRPLDMLPTNVLNVRGLLVRQGTPEWALVTTAKRFIHTSVANVELRETGDVSGTLESKDEGYSSLARRIDLREKRDLDVAKQVFDCEHSGAAIDSVVVSDKDSVTKPLRIWVSMTAPAYAQVSGDLIYINPFIIDRQRANPFKVASRQYPIDMSYRRSMTTYVNLKIPEGFEVKEVPEDKQTRFSNDDAMFYRKITTDGGVIRVAARLEIMKSEFPPSLYRALKSFYEQITGCHAEQIVLQRQKAAASKPTKR